MSVAVDRVRAAFRRIAEVDRPEVWITLRSESDCVADALAVQARLDGGAQLPLAGLLVAVKDNVDVAGLPTTAGCPEFSYLPPTSATAVDRLVAAGAIVLGKTNLDQFATGLVGVRSPYGAVRCAWNPELVSGGSSSGSAVAVALGVADLGIGTDTAGSGRVPAAFNGIVGIKGTLGLVPATGVVPACADYDCVTVFAARLSLAVTALAVMAGPDEVDPRSRAWPVDAPLAAPPSPRVGVPRAADLQALDPGYAKAFTATVDRLAATGAELITVDISELLAAALLLYDGAIVAQRYAAVGEFLAGEPAGADPSVAAIIGAAGRIPGHEVLRDQERLLHAKRAAGRLFTEVDVLLLPTTTQHPTIAAVRADPFGINRSLGTFTNFCNLVDLCAVAVPGEPAATGPFGVMTVAPAFADQLAIDVAARVLGEPAQLLTRGSGVEVAVFGAHLRGQPLNQQLTGGRFLGEISTSADYRLVALDTVPAKPGLVRDPGPRAAPIAGESWLLPVAALGRLVAQLPPPMSLTPVQLSDGRWVVGFGCAVDAALAGRDITASGGWLHYLAGTG